MKISLHKILQNAYKEPRNDLRMNILNSFKQEYNHNLNLISFFNAFKIQTISVVAMLLVVSVPFIYEVNKNNFADPELAQIDQMLNDLSNLQNTSDISALTQLNQELSNLNIDPSL